MPPLAGMAMHNMSLWLLPFLNTAVFFAGLQLLRYAYSDLVLLNVLVSVNYTRAGARYNSENALVIEGMPELADRYLQHWQSRWDAGTDYRLPY